MLIVTNLLDQSYSAVLLPVWVRKELNSPIALGTIAAVFGVGAVAGNALMAWLAPHLPRRLPFALSFLICGAPRFLAPALSTSLLPVLIVACISGIGAGGLNPAPGRRRVRTHPASAPGSGSWSRQRPGLGGHPDWGPRRRRLGRRPGPACSPRYLRRGLLPRDPIALCLSGMAADGEAFPRRIERGLKAPDALPYCTHAYDPEATRGLVASGS